MPACPLVDCHTHTSFSDGHASFEDNVRAAAAAAAASWSRPTTLPCPPVWMLTARCRSSRATCRHIVWPLRTPANSPRRLRRSSPLSTVLNAIGTRLRALGRALVPGRRRTSGQRALDWQPGRYCGRRRGHGRDRGRRAPRYTRFPLRLDRRRYQPACLGKLRRARRVGVLRRRLVPCLRKLTQL
mgnify:CR=1 FL=1